MKRIFFYKMYKIIVSNFRRSIQREINARIFFGGVIDLHVQIIDEAVDLNSTRTEQLAVKYFVLFFSSIQHHHIVITDVIVNLHVAEIFVKYISIDRTLRRGLRSLFAHEQ